MNASDVRRGLLVSTLALLPLSLLGQGEVYFQNGLITFRTVADRSISHQLANGSCEKLVGTNFIGALYYVPGGQQGFLLTGTGGTRALARGSTSATYVQFRPLTTAYPGYWLFQPQPFYVLEGVGQGETATLQVRVWDSALHQDFGDAYAAGSAIVSAPFDYTVPTGAPGRPLLPSDFYMENLRAFSDCFPGPSAAVPEPSTVALLALGLVALLTCHRWPT